MATDVFGDLSLFDEFEKDRSSNASFIAYDITTEGTEDKSKILFKPEASDDESSSESDAESESETENENRAVDNGTADTDAVEQNTIKTTSFKLQHERNKLKRFANLIDSTRCVPDTDSPACQVIFHNNKFSRKYRTYIENFLTGLMYKESFDESHLPQLDLEPSTLTCVDINDKLTAAQRTKSMWESHAIIGCSQLHPYFLIDTLGWPLVNLNPSLTDSWEVPKFDQCYYDPLPFDGDEPSKKPERPKPSCFNCGGEHMISECQEPKDFQKIKRNKAEFLDKSSHKEKLTGSRYHKDEIDPRFAAFRPGQISDKLQEALGISSNQIPLYVYRMRMLGYPPGWLEEAKKEVSGLVMFDKHGKEVDSAGQSMEDGEVNEQRVQPPEIDTSKVIEYPGFTVELEEGMIDEHAELDFPPLQPHQLKSVLVEQQQMKDDMKKRQSNFGEEQVKKRLKVETAEADMDLEDEEGSVTTNGKFQSPLPYSSSPLRRGNRKGGPPLPGNPPLPCDTPPGKPPLPDGTPPPTPEDILRRRRPAFPGEPPLPENTPPSKPPLPKETPPPTPDMPSPIHRQFSSASSKSERSQSPTMEDLQKQYELIQSKLARDEDSQEVDLQVVDSVGEEEDSVNDSSQDSFNVGAGLTRQGSTTSILTFGELGTGSPCNSLPGTPLPNQELELSKNKSISKDFGTPIFMRTISKEKLPAASSFGQGIEDHIPFENLPDSTGSYSKMSQLIGKIRNRIKKKK